MAKLSPVFNDQTVDVNGNPLSGGKLFTYVAGSSTKVTTYTDSAGTVPQTNPIILNSLGYPTNGPIWLTEGQSVKFVLAPSTDTDPPTSPIKTIDNVQGVNDATVSISQWQASGVIPTYVNGNTFTTVGDQTSAFQPGRREQFTVSGGTVYGNIVSSAYTTLTTVTMQMDGTSVLDAGLSAVNHSILLTSPSAEPSIKTQSFQMGSSYGNFSILEAEGAAVASAATTPIWAATDGNTVHVTGNVTITSFGTAPVVGAWQKVIFDGTPLLTQSANLNLNAGGANIQIRANDMAFVYADTTTQMDVFVIRADGSAIGGLQYSTIRTVAASETVPATSYGGLVIGFQSGAITLTLPVATYAGQTMSFQNAGTGIITITAPGTGNFYGGNLVNAGTLTLNPGESAKVVVQSLGSVICIPISNVSFFGAPQTIQGFNTTTRASGSTYTNSTGREITFFVSGTTSGSTGNFAMTVNGSTVLNPGWGNSVSSGLMMAVPIPKDATYGYVNNGYVINTLAELR